MTSRTCGGRSTNGAPAASTRTLIAPPGGRAGTALLDSSEEWWWDAGFLGGAEPSPDAQRIYDDSVEQVGYVMNLSRLWAHQPAALEGLLDLVGLVARAGRSRSGSGASSLPRAPRRSATPTARWPGAASSLARPARKRPVVSCEATTRGWIRRSGRLPGGLG